MKGGGAEEIGVAATGSDVDGDGVEEDIYKKCEIANFSRNRFYTLVIPTNHGEKSLRSKNLPEWFPRWSESPAVAFSSRWLVGLKNSMNSKNFARRRWTPVIFRQTPVRRRKEARRRRCAER